MSQGNVELARKVLEGLATQDPDTLIELSHPDVEWHSFFALGEGGVYRGHEGTRRYMSDLADAWEVGRSGTAPLPPKKLRNSNKARYVAKIGSEASLALKLARRMIVTRVTAAGGKVTIAGRVIGPLAAGAKDRAITLQRVVACKSTETVKKFMPAKSGAFSITVAAPPGQKAAVYRLSTRVRKSAKSKALTNTFTLPRAIDFG
jgi:hypothetical protein